MSHKVSSCEVLIAGGGIIGAACARALALRGLRVLICEPGPEPAAASAASAGILGPQIERTDEALRALGLRARDLYDTLAAALSETTGIDIGLWREGIASLGFEEAEAERLRDAVAHQRQAGLRCDWLEPAVVAERSPGRCPSNLSVAKWRLRRGRPTCRVRCCITTTATSWRAAAKRSSAARWSTRGSTAA